MISSMILLLGLLVAGFMLIATRSNMYNSTTEKDRWDKEYTTKVFNLSWLMKPLIYLGVFIVLSIVNPYKLDRVEAGYIGISVNLTGDSRGVSDYTYKTGWVVYNTWTQMLYQYPTFNQHIEYGDQNVITKGGFSAVINPTFNYTLVPESVGDMFNELRLDIKAIEQGWLRTAIIGSVQDVSNRWEVDKIFNEREKFELAIVQECNKRVGKWFLVDQLRTNIVPPPALQEAIVNKTKAIQETQAKIQEALVAEANAKKMIEIARGDSAKAVIDAAGKAEALRISSEAEANAIRLKQQQVNSQYIEFIKAERWNGVMPTTVLGGNTGTLINL